LEGELSPSALPLAQPAAHVGWTERVSKIDAGGEPDHGRYGNISLQRPAQTRLVSDTRRPSRGGRARIAIAAKIEARRPILPHALHLQPEPGALSFSIQLPPRKIPLA
jgi:hypothetical protein